jgi:hypothetical protein
VVVENTDGGIDAHGLTVSLDDAGAVTVLTVRGEATGDLSLSLSRRGYEPDGPPILTSTLASKVPSGPSGTPRVPSRHSGIPH